MTTNTPEQNQAHDSVYTYAALLGIAAGWRYQSVTAGVLAAICAAIAIYGHDKGHWQQVAAWAWPHLQSFYVALKGMLHRADEAQTIPDLYELCVGQEVETKQYIITDLDELGSFGVFAITGGGKTSFIHFMIHQLIGRCSPNDLRLAIADLKEGLDFRIYKRLPHLLFPIATNTEEAERVICGLVDEMVKRAELYKAIPEDRLCNSLDDYHRLGAGLNLPRLPRIVAIIDEFQVIVTKADALAGLVDLAKRGRAFGISLICATQLPKVDSLPTDLKSQFSSVMCGYLKNPSHYYKIVETTKEHWQPFHENGKIAGRFMADIAGNITTIQSVWIPRKELEGLARTRSEGNEEPAWPEVKPRVQDTYTWHGTADQKRAALVAWLTELDEPPTADQAADTFGFSTATFYNWNVLQMWNDIHSKL